jgi:hypothetical protein
VGCTVRQRLKVVFLRPLAGRQLSDALVLHVAVPGTSTRNSWANSFRSGALLFDQQRNTRKEEDNSIPHSSV